MTESNPVEPRNPRLAQIAPPTAARNRAAPRPRVGDGSRSMTGGSGPGLLFTRSLMRSQFVR